MQLYKLSEQYQEAFNTLGAMVEDGQLPAEAMNDTLEALGGELQEKAKNVGAWIKNLEADAKALKEAEQELSARRKTIESRVKWALEYLHRNMEQCGITEIECQLYAIKLAKNPPAVQITGDVPEQYVTRKVTETPDKKAIKALIESGEPCEFAEITQGTRVVIK